MENLLASHFKEILNILRQIIVYAAQTFMAEIPLTQKFDTFNNVIMFRCHLNSLSCNYVSDWNFILSYIFRIASSPPPPPPPPLPPSQVLQPVVDLGFQFNLLASLRISGHCLSIF